MAVIEIYIPTRGRVGENKQVTLREFLNYSKYRPILVCSKEEAPLHKKYYSNVLVCPILGIGNKRQWLLENSKADIMVMADDDMRFSYRPKPAITKLKRCTNLSPLITLIKKCVIQGKVVHGGIGARQGNNFKDLSSPRNGFLRYGHAMTEADRVTNVHFLDRKKVLSLGIKLNALTVMEDFHYTLSLLTQGYPNRVIHSYVYNQQMSGQEGGCSIYRTPKVQTEAANGLAKAFPDFVKVVTKVSKESSPSWQGFKERTDVNIRWLKAYKYGVQNKKPSPA